MIYAIVGGVCVSFAGMTRAQVTTMLDGRDVVFSFIPKEEYDGAAAAAAEPGHVPITTSHAVTMRQARLALHAAGLLATVNAAISAADEAVKIEWEYAGEVRRDSPLVQSLSASLSLSSAQLDALFTQAASL